MLNVGRQRAWMLQHPVFMCGFRPFFFLAGLSACIDIVVWLVILNGHLIGWQPMGGVVLWHAHELIYGFGGAAIAGFALTAVPEFTGAAGIGRQALGQLAAL